MGWTIKYWVHNKNPIEKKNHLIVDIPPLPPKN